MWNIPNLYQILRDWEEVDKRINQLPWIVEIEKELESTLLSDKFRYSPQIPVIRDCLKEAFGEYSLDIKIVNRFLVELDNFLMAYNDYVVFPWDKNSKEWQFIDDRYNAKRVFMIEYFSHYWRTMYDKLEEKYINKWIEEVMKIWNDMEQNFLELLLQRIQYIPNKE